MDGNAKLMIQDSDFVPVLRHELTEGTSYPGDVYLRLGQNSYLLIARRGDKANLKELQLKDEVTLLYFKKEDYKNLVGQSLSIAGVVMKREDISVENKTVFLSKAATSVYKELTQLGMNRESLDHAKIVAGNIKTLIDIKKDISSVLSMFANLSGGLMNHAMAVSMVSVVIARQMGWTLEGNLEKLSLGSLLLDIGLKELPEELLKKPRHELTSDERVLFETHPFRGAEILRSMPSISDEIISIVYEHHENAIGTGFPRRTKDLKMNPLAKVVCLANAFCELTIQNQHNPRARSSAEALEYLEVTLGQPFNKQAFFALKELLGEEKIKPAA